MSRYAVRRCIGVALLSALFACDEHARPTAPGLATLETPAQLLRAGSAKRAKLLKRATALDNDVVTSARITPAGGALSIEEAGLVVLFPRGAVSEDVVITATAVRGKELVYTFEPHGLAFNVPIVLAQQLSSSAYSRKHGESTPDVQGGYLAAGTRDVDPAGIASVAETYPAFFHEIAGRTYLVFSTTHFSGYSYLSGRAESSGANLTMALP